MSLHHAAQHLASKGRNGDSTLVHMTKGEVAGLQALAKRHGTTLTKNPDTGLPEAFGLKQLLPMAAGAALTPFVGPVGAAAIVGGLGYMHTGSLSQGLMAGMGAYGGAGLMGGVTQAGAQQVAGEAVAQEAATNQAEAALAEQAAASQQSSLNTLGQSATTPQAIESVSTQQAAFNAQPYDMGNAADMSFARPAAQIPSSTYGLTSTPEQLAAAKANTGFTDLASKGFSSAFNDPSNYVTQTGGGMQTAKYGLAAASPIIADKMTPDAYVPPEIKGDSDMGQRYAYDSGYDNNIPGRTGQPAYNAISNEEAKKLYGFAEGGDVQYPYGESVVRMATGGTSGAATPSVGYEASPYSSADYSGYGGVDAGNYSGYGNGNVGNYSGYDTAPNMGIAAVAPAATRAMTSNFTAPSQGLRYNPVSRTFIGSAPGGDTIYKGGGEYGLTEAAQKAADEAAAAEAAAAEAAAPAPTYDYGGGGAAQGGLMQSYAQGGISTLGGYSDGGRLLKGPGDGMSDNIPAQIGAKQPARLADGEFVVPADVVSHLGNGSTDAGAKQLYKMMDKIRQARTGRKAQGKQINPTKFTPA